MTEPLAEVPARLVGPDRRLVTGLWQGEVTADPVAAVSRRPGRVRRWTYVAAGNHRATVGAAVADVGLGTTSFAWALVEGRLWAWERTSVVWGRPTVPERPDGTASAHDAANRVTLTPRGVIRFDLVLDHEHVTAVVEPASAGRPAVCATPTPAGGWNVTQKHAGYAVTGELAVGDQRWDLAGTGWSDWTAGRQDRRTSWRWAAGGGTSPEHGRVGLNVSTGMNGAGPGEDVVWWDGVPHPLDVTRLAPRTSDARGPWRVEGPGWELTFVPRAVRAADENLLVVRSRYVQPIGEFEGTLPCPDGSAANVRLVGVTEAHHARW